MTEDDRSCPVRYSTQDSHNPSDQRPPDRSPAWPIKISQAIRPLEQNGNQEGRHSSNMLKESTRLSGGICLKSQNHLWSTGVCNVFVTTAEGDCVLPWRSRRLLIRNSNILLQWVPRLLHIGGSCNRSYSAPVCDDLSGLPWGLPEYCSKFDETKRYLSSEPSPLNILQIIEYQFFIRIQSSCRRSYVSLLSGLCIT